MSDGVAGGLLVDGRFRLTTPLGRGNTGRVWQAVDEQTGRPVAVKLHRGHPGQDPAAGVSHPCVVSIFFNGTHEGAAYTVREFVDGVSLATLLQEGPVPADDAVAIALGVCDALWAAHAAGVAHGNLKPSNVLIADGGGRHPVVKVGDFSGQGDPREDMYALGLLMEAMDGSADSHRSPTVERLLSRDPYTPTQLRSILTGSASRPVSPRGGADDEDEPEGRRLVRLGVVTGVATLAVVIAACAWFLEPSTLPDVASGGQIGVRTTSVAGPDAAPAPGPNISRPPGTPPAAPSGNTGGGTGTVTAGNTASAAAVNEVRSVIDDQLRAGNIQQDAASMLNSRLDDFVRFQSRGQSKQADDRIDTFKSQLASMRRSDKVTAAGYDAILASVNKLSAQ